MITMIKRLRLCSRLLHWTQSRPAAWEGKVGLMMMIIDKFYEDYHDDFEDDFDDAFGDFDDD